MLSVLKCSKDGSRYPFYACEGQKGSVNSERGDEAGTSRRITQGESVMVQPNVHNEVARNSTRPGGCISNVLRDWKTQASTPLNHYTVVQTSLISSRYADAFV